MSDESDISVQDTAKYQRSNPGRSRDSDEEIKVDSAYHHDWKAQHDQEWTDVE